MFGLFTKKKLLNNKVFTSNDVKEEVLKTYLMNIGLLDQLVTFEKLSSERINSINSEIEKLKSIGAINSLNYKQLVKIIEDEDDRILQAKIAEEIINNLILFKELFGDKIRLIPLIDFEKIIIKYGLVCAPINLYKGAIPKEDIDIIKNSSEKINSRIMANKITKYSIITRIKLSCRYDTSDTEAINAITKSTKYNHFNLIDSNSGSFLNNNQLSEFYNVKLKDNIYSAQIETKGSSLLLIAAKHEDLDINKPKIYMQKVEDPIVFCITKYGVLVLTSWGEESNDELLKKHMNVLKKVVFFYVIPYLLVKVGMVSFKDSLESIKYTLKR